MDAKRFRNLAWIPAFSEYLNFNHRYLSETIINMEWAEDQEDQSNVCFLDKSDSADRYQFINNIISLIKISLRFLSFG